MDTEVHVKDVIHEYIRAELLQGDGQALDSATPLLEWGIIASMSMLALVRFIEERFRLSLPHHEITPANFANINTIAAMVIRVRGES